MHYGATDGETLLRYNNAHERMHGHEPYVGDDVTEIEFPGIVDLFDRLLVLPDAFHIIDYKTNDLSATTSDELAAHYRPQMLAYALALLQHDRTRDVRASLRFIDEGIEERFHWDPEQMAEIKSELRSMVDLVD
jgi:ATP-dependent helicase/nuclease subunit A